jgi:hypothetical protein
MAVLLVDGTVVQYLYLAEGGQFNEAWMDHAINRISKDYEKIYYEDRSGQSNFQARLHSSDQIGKKLFALEEGIKPYVEEDERLLIRETAKRASSYRSIKDAIQEYEQLKQGPSRQLGALIGYTIRLLLLARQLRADLWAWKGRAALIRAIFSEAGYPLRAMPEMPDLFETNHCAFPYLPEAPSTKAKHVYRLLDPQSALGRTDSTEVILPTIRRSVRAFVSYSHQDDKYREELEKHLSVMKRRGLVETWSDRIIQASDDWKGAIDRNLQEADIILLLVSADFCASEYCWDVEMQRAIERHQSGEAKVIPISIRPCDWKGAPFAKFQGLPRDLRPISLWENRDSAWLAVVEGISRLITSL